MTDKITEKNLSENSENPKPTTAKQQTTDKPMGEAGESHKKTKEEMLEKAKQAHSNYKEQFAQFPPERQHQKKMSALIHGIMIFLGNFLQAFAFQGFVDANGFLSGGAFGLAGIFTHFLPWFDFALAVFLFSVPMLIVGWLNIDKKFVILTTISILLQVVMLKMFEGLVIYNNDTLLASIFGGVLLGCGDGLVLRGGSGTSGIHLVAMTVKKKLGFSISTITMAINLLIVFCSAGIFGLEKGLYTLILIFVAGRVAGTVVDGISRKRTAFIVTTKGKEIGDQLMEFLNRGVTMMPGTGLYSGNQTDVLFCVVNVVEVAKLKQIVRDIDMHAFITVYETAELEGHFTKNSFLFDKRSDE